MISELHTAYFFHSKDNIVREMFINIMAIPYTNLWGVGVAISCLVENENYLFDNMYFSIVEYILHYF